jgi:hypothetical protein
MARDHEGHVQLCARCHRPTPGHEFSPGCVSAICVPGTGCLVSDETTVEEEQPAKKKK